MNGQTCAVLANIIPIFLIALIAERAVSRKSPLALRTAKFVIDFALATVMLALEIGLLIGVENGGLHKTAPLAWVGTFLILLAVLYRWALLSPAPNDFFDTTFDAAVRLLGKRFQYFRNLSEHDFQRQSRGVQATRKTTRLSRGRASPSRARATRMVRRNAATSELHPTRHTE